MNQNKSNELFIEPAPDSNQFCSYRVNVIPSRFDAKLQSGTGQDPAELIFPGWASLLRFLSSFPPASVSFSILFSFNSSNCESIQDRLSLYLLLSARDRNFLSAIANFLEHGPLAPFYSFQPESSDPGLSLLLGDESEEFFISEILHREEAIDPLISPEEHPERPSFYYLLSPFQPQAENDYLLLDSVFHAITVPVRIVLAVQPCDPTAVIEFFTRYLALVHHLGSYYRWEEPNPNDAIWEDFGQKPSPWSSKRAQVLQPYRRRDPMAVSIPRRLRDWEDTLPQSTLLFRAAVLSPSEPTSRLVGVTVAESAFKEGSYRIFTYGKEALGDRDILDDLRHGVISFRPNFPGIWGRTGAEIYTGFHRCGHMASVDELSSLIRLPLAGRSSLRTIRISTDPQPGNQSGKFIVFGIDVELSSPHSPKNSPQILEKIFKGKMNPDGWIIRPLEILSKHGFVAGIPGKGKTNWMFTLLLQLYRQEIPFLILEPAKTEYRILATLESHPLEEIRRLAKELRLFTVGNERISPMRFNPFWHPPDLTTEEHISNLIDCFKGAMPIFAALPSILAEALLNCYGKYRQGNNWPTFEELFQESLRVLAAREYCGETHSDMRGALESRIGLLTRLAAGKVFSARECIPDISSLLRHPTLLELDYMSTEQACLLILFLLSTLREYIKTTRPPGTPLQHVIVIEEAHTIIGKSTDAAASEISPDPRAFATRFLCRMLAEFRALGEGVIIVDQSPSAVAPEVVRLTGTKLAMGLVADEERSLMGSAMLFGTREYEEIARFLPGAAYLFTEGFYAPRRIQTLNFQELLGGN